MTKLAYYLSFCDPDAPVGTQFLGACIVFEDSMIEAVQTAHRLGINPGGEVAGMGPFPAHGVNEGFAERRLTATEARSEAIDPAKLYGPAPEETVQ